MSDERSATGDDRREVPDMTRERARSERRDVDMEQGEPLAGGSGSGRPRALRTPSRPVTRACGRRSGSRLQGGAPGAPNAAPLLARFRLMA